MGKWMCKCGQLMSDRICPNENGYIVYSEFVWSEIIESADHDNKIDWFNIPDPQFDVYQCPSCGRIMVFGESGKCVIYKPENDSE